MGMREEQKEKRRQDILYCGLKLFVCKGYAGTKISDIAKQVGMSSGLLFHYFESKEKLYEELIKIGISGPMSVMSISSEEPIAFFEESAKQIFSYLKTRPFYAYMFLLMNQAYCNEDAPQSVKELLAGFDIYTPTARLIEEGQKNKTIREGDANALAIAFWCAVQGIAEEMAIHPELPCPDSKWIVDIIRRW